VKLAALIDRPAPAGWSRATVKGLGVSIRRRIPEAGLLARRARHSLQLSAPLLESLERIPTGVASQARQPRQAESDLGRLVEIVRRAQDAHTAPGMEYKKVVVAAHDGFSAAARASSKYLLSFGSRQSTTETAGSYQSAAPRRIHVLGVPVPRKSPRQLRRTAHVRLLGTQQRRLRYAVNLERGAYDG
jgi:hypothetical protein